MCCEHQSVQCREKRKMSKATVAFGRNQLQHCYQAYEVCSQCAMDTLAEVPHKTDCVRSCHGGVVTSAKHNSSASSTSELTNLTNALPTGLNSRFHSQLIYCCLIRSLGLFSTAPATAVRVSRARVPSLPAAVTAALLTSELDSLTVGCKLLLTLLE